MFLRPEYPPSGLTKEDCDLMAKYLNKEHNPVPDCKFVYWKSNIVAEHDDWRLEMESQTPIVCLNSVYNGRDGLSRKECYKIDAQIKKYFDTHFPKNYLYNEDQGVYYITDRTTLAKLRDEALAAQPSHKPGKSS